MIKYFNFYALILFFLIVNNAFCQGFKENKGQLITENGHFADEILYYAYSGDLIIYLRKTGFSYEIRKSDSLNNKVNLDLNIPQVFHFNRIDIDFFDHSSEISYSVSDELKYSETFYRGSDFVRVNSYNTVTYKNVYDNIDFVFKFEGDNFKYDIVLAPGADLRAVKLSYNSPFITVLEDSGLNIHADLGVLHEKIPYSFFPNNSERKVRVDFELLTQSNSFQIYGFKASDDSYVYDELLIIDPLPNQWFGTYISGNNEEFPQSVCVDDDGNIYVVGFTNSTNNIATVGVFQGSLSAVYDVFIVKYNPDGEKMWGTYIGGNNFDRAYDIVYKNGFLYICGSTYSLDYATPGVHQTASVNGDEAFVAKFDSNGFRVWCSYYGGELHDFAASLVVNNAGDIYITGHTLSYTNMVTVGAHQESFFGVSAAFLAKFSTQGQLLWGTYYGSSFQEGYGIDLDSQGNVIFSGFTTSSSGIASPGAHQTVLGGTFDAFVAKFNPNGERQWGTYIGGSEDDFGYDVCVDSQDNIYLMGNTSSENNISFGTGFQLIPSSVDDGFVAKFNPTGVLQWSTYIGGNDAEYLKAIGIYFNDGVIVVGKTQSAENIATPGALVNSLQGEYDGFLMKILANGSLEWGSYYGGPQSEEFTGVAIRNSNGYIHAVGFGSSNVGIATPDAHQTQSFGGMFNGFLAQFCSPVIPYLIHDIGIAVCDDNDYTIEVGPVNFNSYLWNTGSTQPSLELSDLIIGNNYEFFVNTIDTNNCAYNSEVLSFGVFPEISVTIEVSQTTYCAHEPIFLSVEDTFLSYSWSTGGNQASETTQFNTGGNQLVIVEATDINGCVAVDEVLLNILPAPNPPVFIAQGSTNFCIGETIEISTTENYFAFNWSNGSNQSSVIISEDTWLYLTVYNELGCSVTSDSIWLGSGELDPKILILSDPPICPGVGIEFGLTQSYDNYLWSTGSTSETTSLIAQPGMSFIAVEVSNLCGDYGFDTLFFMVPDFIPANISFDQPDTICYNSEITFSLPGSWNSILWLNSFSGDILTAQPNIFGPWEVFVEAIASNGCPVFDTILLNVLNCYLGLKIENSGIQVFPNPFEDVIFVATDSHLTEVEIYDVSGKRVARIDMFTDSEQLQLDFLGDGLYYLSFKNEDLIVYRVIVVKLKL